MLRFEGHFDELDFSEAYYGPARVVSAQGGARLVIPCVGVAVSTHPLHPGVELRFVQRAYLDFEGVRGSRKMVKDYAAARDAFVGEPYAEIDLDEPGHDPTADEVFRLEGVADCGARYVWDWLITARSFALCLPEGSTLRPTPWPLFSAAGVDVVLATFLTDQAPLALVGSAGFSKHR